MNRLSEHDRWDYIESFSAKEMAALIQGTNVESFKDIENPYEGNPVFRRIVDSYLAPYFWGRQKLVSRHLSAVLMSVDKSRVTAKDSEWTNSEKGSIELQLFDRDEIAKWLIDNQLKSVYQFNTENVSKVEELDPSELPEELHAANTAFRAVLNGHGDQSATFKNRLIDFLKKNNSHLTAEAIDRIATVANPDKARGRKKRDTE